MSPAIHKLARLFVPDPLGEGKMVQFPPAQAHYLKNVLRLNENDQVRAFNGHDGEWLITLQTLTKKNVDGICQTQLKQQAAPPPSIHLYFAPIKKARMDFLIEKAVELGVSHFHPILTERTEVRKLNEERLTAQIIEASEQCERMDIPKLHPVNSLPNILSGGDIPILAGIERDDTARTVNDIEITSYPVAALIGPEGGFTNQEITYLHNHKTITPISLGQNILRAETAVCKVLSCISKH